MHEILSPLNLLSRADASRRIANGKLKVETKSAFGQYMTSATVASFMASLFPAASSQYIRLLDPGAGVGSLTSAFIEHICKNKTVSYIHVDAYEIDPVMRSYLEKNLELCATISARSGRSVTWRILAEDFVIEAAKNASSFNSLWHEEVDNYTHCIMNPPYKKISSESRHRACLRTAGIETVNLYSAFVALSLLLLEKGGYLVAIIPRSFCNGPYYRPFREFMMKHAAIRRIHLFGSRDKAFKEDKVLQENIILVLEKGGRQKAVTVSTSMDDTFADTSISDYSFAQIVKEDDKELFIHIPSSPESDFLNDAKTFNYTLPQIGIQVSTGPVVDFRMKAQLHDMPESGTAPLLYPCHFKEQFIQWPIEGGKKPNAIRYNRHTQKWLYPNGFYTVVRRFSSKEEKRRIVASVVDPAVFGEAEKLGFENHLNVFHSNKEPLTEAIARGLSVFLNSTTVDHIFRRFSGHTQVNATDLKLMKYPSRNALIELGKWAIKKGELTQETIDEEVERISE
ncbi:MAG: Eco57I restriction-modification methylase domain-containing protein [Sedimentisphaerales bacterium]|nr:Eco57I restriction-modification methylase domain-containing protein [Sedimentisphaerales bacterium]